MENSVDPVHTEWLHGHLHEFVEEQRDGIKPSFAISRHHVKIAFDEFEYGIYKRRLLEGQSEDADDWKVGHPVLFPNMLAVGRDAAARATYSVPDSRADRRRQHDALLVHASTPCAGVEVPRALARPASRSTTFRSATTDGEFMLDMLDAQDIMAWVTQGPIAERELEKLGTTDRGVILFRKMLEREIEQRRGRRGSDGRHPRSRIAVRIDLPLEYDKGMLSDGFATRLRGQSRYYPYREDLLRILAQSSGPVAAAG